MKNFKAGCRLDSKGNTESRRWSMSGCLKWKLSSKLNHFEMIKMFGLNKIFPLLNLSLFRKWDVVNTWTMGQSCHCWKKSLSCLDCFLYIFYDIFCLLRPSAVLIYLGATLPEHCPACFLLLCILVLLKPQPTMHSQNSLHFPNFVLNCQATS